MKTQVYKIQGRQNATAPRITKVSSTGDTATIVDHCFSTACQRKLWLSMNTTNTMGLPNDLKAGVESLSGYAMDNIKVHYNSTKPVQLQAHAYTRGTGIHPGPGQEKHLPHEAWHVVKQKKERVKPITQLKGMDHQNDKTCHTYEKSIHHTQ